MTSYLREPFRRPTTEAPPGALPEEGLCRLAGVLVLAACGVFGPAALAAADGYPPVDLAASTV